MKAVCRLLVVTCALATAWCASVQEAYAAVAQQVQSGTAVNQPAGPCNAPDCVQQITGLSGFDPAKSFLIFQTRSNSNRPVASTLRGRINTPICLNPCTTIEFVRVSDEASPVAINIQWYVVTFGSGVKVQHGEVAQSLTVVDVPITPVASLSQAFVLFSKTPFSGDQSWSQDDAALGELTTTSNLEFRANTADAAKIIAWQVVEFTNAADINVQKGSITTMTGTTTSVTATLSPAVNVNKTFVLTGWQTPGTGPNIGTRMLRARLTDSSTITIDRGVGNQTIALRNASSAGAASGNLTINKPTGTVEGDVMIAAIGVDPTSGPNPPTITAPSAAWTLVRQADMTTGAATRNSLAVFRAVAGASEPASYTWTITTNSGSAGGIQSFSGVDTTNPINVDAAPHIASGNLFDTVSVNTTVANTMVVTNHSFASSNTWTPPGGMAEAFEVASLATPNAAGQSTEGNYVLQAAAGATGIKTATAGTGTNDRGFSHILALTPKNDDISEIVWQAVELKDASTVWSGSENFTAGTAQKIVSLPPPQVNTTRAVAFISSQGGNGQSMGRTPYAGDDIIGVGSVTASLSAGQPTQLTLDRNNTVDSTDVGWFVVQFDRGSGFKVGSFTKSIGGAPVTQTIAHGLGEVPKAIILWTDGNTNESFSGSYLFGYGMTDGTTSRSVAAASLDAGTSNSSSSSRMAAKALTIVQWGNVLVAEADLQSWDDTNFTLNWTTNNATAYVIHFIAIGGTDVSAKVVDWTMATATGNQAITGVGFQPNVVIHAYGNDTFTGALNTNRADAGFGLGVMDADGDQWALAHYALDNVATSNTQRGQQTNGAIYSFDDQFQVKKQASWVSMDANGFTLNFTTATLSASRAFSLALKGLNVKPGSFLKSTTTATGTATWVRTSAQNPPATQNHAQTFGGVSTSGNLIVVSLNVGAGASVQAIWDSKGNTYNLAAGPTAWNGGQSVVTYYASNIIGGGAAITIHVDLTASTSLEFYQTEYSGVSTTTPLDQISVGTGTSTAPNGMDSGSKTTTYSNELIYGFGMSCGTGTVDGSFNARSTFDSNFVADKSATTVGAYNVFGTSNCAGWVVDMLTFNVGTSQSVTGVGFRPSAVLLTSFQDVTQANPVGHSRFGLGASDGPTQGSSALVDTDAVSTKYVKGIDKTSKAFMKDNNSNATPSNDAEADLVSLGTDGFTLNWSTNDAVATQILYLALARIDVTEVRLLSFTATRYDRGVLLQWATGYEIDNLGFHVYRDINGVRTRVNRSLVAGSGLMAGRGTAVTAEQRYALWDLDAAASSGSVVYWLEDLDMNGKSTWHGPVTPVAGGLLVPDVPTSTALHELGRRGKRRVFVDHGEAEEHERRGRRAWRAMPQTPVTAQWTLAGQPAVKIGIETAGWYRVGQAELLAAGLNPRVDPRTLRLFVDGTEQAVLVRGETDGRLDPGDAIEFYATGVDTPSTDRRVYWLASGNQRGQRIAMNGSAAVSAVTGMRGAASFSSTLLRKDRSIYFAALRNGDTENWFGDLVSEYPTDLTLTVSNIDRAAAGPAQLEVALQGVTNTPDVNPDHRVGVLVNGTDVGEMAFDGQDHRVQTFAVPVGTLLDGDNTVTLVARGGEADYSLVDTLRLSYWHTYRADADRLRFSVDFPGPTMIGGFVSSAIRVVDITDPAAAVELRGAVRAEAGGFSSITVHVPGPGPRMLLAFTEATIGSPASVQTNHPSSWHASTQAHDYVVVAHHNFLDQVQPLAAQRARQGHHPAVVDIEDVYDEFSFGEKTPQALKDFVQWAQKHWREPPRFVVLVGDATIDPRDYAGFGDADFVPTKQVPMAQVALETASDDWFVDFDDDGLPDLAIGRLPVRTAVQAHTMVAKTVGYEQAGDQPWTKDVLLVADQNDDNTNFEASSARLSARLPAGYAAHDLFRGGLDAAIARGALIDRVNDGQLIVNYQGHGSVHIWGRDGELLTNDDVYGSWRNGSRLPLVVAMNCLNGFFHGIWDEESLAEAMLRAPEGGAVAAWASSSVTASATQALVNEELFRLIFQGAYATVGEAAAAAKRVVTNRDLRRSWIFFGDPALRLAGVVPPSVSPRTATSPTPVAMIAAASTSASSSAPGSANATGLAALDARGGPVRLADFNGDGRDDIFLYAAETGRWTILLSGSDGAANPSGYWPPHLQVFAATLNADRLADMFLHNDETGEWLAALNTSDGGFRLGPSAWTPRGRVRLGDFNGDGRDDVFVVDGNTGLWTECLTATVQAGLQTRLKDRTLTCHSGDALPPGRLLVSDFTGDGLADVLTYDAATGQWTLGVNDGGGAFNYVSGTWAAGWTVRAATLDGNRRRDLVLTDPLSGAWVEAFSGARPGEFTYRRGQGPAGGGDVRVIDVDGDGRDDLLYYNAVTGQWSIGVNVAPGEFTYSSGVWAPGLTIAWGDVNGDGRADLILHDPATGRWGSLVSRRPSGVTAQSGTWSVGWAMEGWRP